MQKEIDGHKQAFIQTGHLSDFHLNNMKQAVPLFFKQYGLGSVSVDYNFLDELGCLIPGHITFNLTFSGIPTYTKEDKETRRYLIEKTMKSIFFEETVVSFKVKGKSWN